MNTIPDEFICPIYKDVMVYPFITAAGVSYEYAAIVAWLEGKNIDPLTGVTLNDTTVFPNNTLRSQILDWLQENNMKPNPLAVKPPPEAYNAGKKFVPLPNQDKILKYLNKTSLKEEGNLKKVKVPESFSAFNHTYTFSSNAKKQNLFLQCDNGTAIEMPDKEVFVTAQGIVFYDSTDYRDTRVLPDTDFKETCVYSIKCNKQGCTYAHPFVCPKGVTCQGGCKFLHPKLSSIVPLGPKYPLNQECKYNTACSDPKCKFAHPNGRMTVPRQKARVFITHSLTLEKLNEPIPLNLNVPDEATEFQFQGEFAFFFQPYSGPWAKEHFENVLAYRFDSKCNSYKYIRNFSLKDHYCNSIAGSGRYIVISFWPYEEEAIRTVWESLRVSREMEKELKKKNLEIKNLQIQVAERDAIISQLKTIISQQQAQLTMATMQAHKAYQEVQRAREEKMAWRKRRQDYERARLERLRKRDPIYIFALQENCSGFEKEDWKLVLDYHKGAHNLVLHKPNKESGDQRLEITENDTVYHFDLVVPANVNIIGNLPLVPGRLCADF